MYLADRSCLNAAAVRNSENMYACVSANTRLRFSRTNISLRCVSNTFKRCSRALWVYALSVWVKFEIEINLMWVKTIICQCIWSIHYIYKIEQLSIAVLDWKRAHNSTCDYFEIHIVKTWRTCMIRKWSRAILFKWKPKAAYKTYKRGKFQFILGFFLVVSSITIEARGLFNSVILSSLHSVIFKTGGNTQLEHYVVFIFIYFEIVAIVNEFKLDLIHQF